MLVANDSRKEDMMLNVNRTLLMDYGHNLILGGIEEQKLNTFTLKFDYNKIFHIVDEKTNTTFVRNIRFKNVYQKATRYNENLELPADEINSAINTEYASIRNAMILKVLSKRDLILALIKNNHISSAYLNKFYTILNRLITDGKLSHQSIEEFTDKKANFDKYIQLIIDEGFGNYDSDKNLISSNKLKLLLKEKKELPETVNEAVYLLVKNHYDYIVYDLKIHILRAYVSIMSCMMYLIEQHNLKDVEMKMDEFYHFYSNFFQSINHNTFLERLNNLIYSGIVQRSDLGVLKLTAKYY